MGHLPKTEMFYCCWIAHTPCPARQRFDHGTLSTVRRLSEQPHVPLSTVMLVEMMDVTLNTLSVLLIQEVWGFTCIIERK